MKNHFWDYKEQNMLQVLRPFIDVAFGISSKYLSFPGNAVSS